MNRPTRVNSDAAKGLLGRQLASITDTLARASQRRDAEVQEKAKPKSPSAPAVQVPSPTDPSLTSDTEGTGSDSGDSVVFDGEQNEPNVEDFSFGSFDLDKPQGDSIARGSLTGDYTSDNKDPKKLFARFGQDEPSPSARNDTVPKQMLAHIHQPNSADSAAAMDEPKKMLAKMSQVGLDNALDGHDLRSMLADLDRSSSVDGSAIHSRAIDPKQPLAQFRGDASTIGEVTIHGNGNNDLKEMLANLDGRSSSPKDVAVRYDSGDDDPRAMLAQLERRTPQLTEETREDGGEDLQALHDRLMGTLSPGPAVQSPALEVTEVPASEAACNPAIVPYVIAFQLELAGCKWEEVRGWTTYLFSSGLDGYKACEEKERIVKLATEELDNIIAYAMGEELRYLGKVGIERLPRRLIVSNLAADAGVEDLEEFFYGHRCVIQEYKILPDRDPIKRTQIAHVDMFTREAAVKASYMRGSIFGLVLNIRLAVEKEG